MACCTRALNGEVELFVGDYLVALYLLDLANPSTAF